MRRVLTDRVLTDDTKACPPRGRPLAGTSCSGIAGSSRSSLGAVDIVESTRPCDSGWDEKHWHTRSDNEAVAVAVSTVAVVVRQLVRGNALAHIVFVPRYHKKAPQGRPRRCVLNEFSHSLTNCNVRQP